MSSNDIDFWLETVKGGAVLPERALRMVCEKVKEILLEESNVQPVAAPVNICGDIHGQFHDLLALFDKGGEIPNARYIFMGDMVDRGYNSCETFQLLILLKVKYPAHITLLRGNHETRFVTSQYGFYDEVMKKYGNPNPWKYCCEVFDYLSIAAVVEGKIFCIHGGLSPEIKSIDQIRLIDRRVEVPHEGPFSDMMWSDPEDIEAWAMNQRGAGWLFGSRVTSEFNHINGIDLIARAHQLVMDGYKLWFREENLVTVWSAPNYCYRCGNVASILKVDDKMGKTFELFRELRDQKQRAVNYKNTVPYFL